MQDLFNQIYLRIYFGRIYYFLFKFVFIYMEDSTQITDLDGSSSPSKDFSSRIVSLPVLLSRRSFSIQDEHYHNGNHRPQNHEAHSSTKFECVNLKIVSKETIYKNVFSFLRQMLNNPSMFSNLLQCFKQLQKQFKRDLKKSKKSICKLKLTVNNLNELSLKQKKKENQIRKISNLKLPIFVKTDDSGQNISLKIINSRDNIINKQNITSFNELITISQAYTIKDQVFKDTLQTENRGLSISQLKQQRKMVRFNLVENSQINQKIEQQCSQSNEDSQKTSQKIFLYKQSSIMVIQEEYDDDSSMFSSEGFLSIKDLDLPTIPFTEEVLSKIYDSPAPFFINFALCIFIKSLLRSKIALNEQNVVYLLGISTLVSYKAYFDETIQGLIDHFAQILLVDSQKIINLQRWFLETIKYEVGVSSQEYQQVMFRLLRQTK